MKKPLLLIATLCAMAFAASSALAAKPTKKECAAANEAAQDLRTAGRLREARASLAVCTAASCPGPVREDCAQRLKEVEAAIPSVVFVARDGTGHDLVAVRVTMDGATLLEKLDGSSLTLDPGEHHFKFESDGFHPAESTVLVREGDTNRPLRVVMKSTAPEPVEAAPVAAKHPSEEAPAASTSGIDSGTRRSLGLSLGAAGAAGVVLGAVFGVLSKLTFDHAFKNDCGGDARNCTPAGVKNGQSANSQATVSTVAFIGGGALLAGGALLFFTAPKSDDVAVSATVSDRGGTLGVSGRW